MRNISVVKRSGKKEPLNIEKVHRMVDEACKGLSGVSASQVEINSGLQFYDNITTNDIQAILIKSASDLISLENPNYQFVAARLLLFSVVKKVFGKIQKNDDWNIFYPTLKEHITNAIKLKIYDSAIKDYYTDEEVEKLNSFIHHERDKEFTYAGLQQVVDKYLIQDRVNGTLFETPQFMYMLIAMVIFHQYPKDTRLQYVRKYYDAISTFKINLPTPIIAGVRTNIRQYASCVLIDVGDTLHSIFSSTTALGYYVSRRAGMGLNLGRIRALGDRIRDGEVVHTGVIPYAKVFEAAVKSTTQNGIRGGSATANFPIWHKEIEDILVLKNNKGTQDNRIRELDYCIHLSKIFYERYMRDEEITLFSPKDVPELYESFGLDTFDDLYIKAERSHKPKKKISARKLINNMLAERAETGRIYIMNIDHANSHSSWLNRVTMTNLCTEITHPTIPLEHIDDPNGEIGTCILSAINLGILPAWGDKAREEIEHLTDLAIRALDALIDYQDYPVKAAETFTKKRRSLGVGYIGLAHYLAKNKVRYSDPNAWKLIHDVSESFQYNLLKTSVRLAKEYGPCEGYKETKYSLGILPIDHYKKDVDDIATGLNYDWEKLREDMLQYGVRNSTVSAQMPAESSAVVSNATNGIEPPRGYISVKKSKKGTLKQIVPGYPHLKSYYSLLWDRDTNQGYIRIVAVMQKFFDQAISSNWSYDPANFPDNPDNEIPLSVLAMDMLTTYKYGHKTAYYLNMYDGKGEEIEAHVKAELSASPTAAADCDACSI